MTWQNRTWRTWYSTQVNYFTETGHYYAGVNVSPQHTQTTGTGRTYWEQGFHRMCPKGWELYGFSRPKMANVKVPRQDVGLIKGVATRLCPKFKVLGGTFGGFWRPKFRSPHAGRGGFTWTPALLFRAILMNLLLLCHWTQKNRNEQANSSMFHNHWPP